MMNKEEILFKDKITIDDYNENIYTQIAKNMAKALDIDLAKTPLVDLITTYTNYITLQQKNIDLQQRIDKAKDKIKELYELGEEWYWDTYEIKDYVEEIDEILGGKE